MTDTASRTPPTTPGKIVSRRSLPLNRMAFWSILTGCVGLFLVPLGLVAIPLGIVGLRRIYRDRGRERGEALAIGGIITGSLALLLSVLYAIAAYSAVVSYGQARTTIAQQGLIAVHKEAARYGRRNGTYPAHLGQLAIDSKGQFDLYRELRVRIGDEVPIEVNGYDLADFDQTPAEMTRLRAALDTVETTNAYYRLGQCWFVRLPKPTGDSDIIFGWYMPENTERAILIMDDGTMTAVKPERWPSRVRDDAVARRKHRIPAAVMPNPFSLAARAAADKDETPAPDD